MLEESSSRTRRAFIWVATGLALLPFYNATAEGAHRSVQAIATHPVLRFARAAHHWASALLILLGAAYLVYSVFVSTHRRPYHLIWTAAVGLFLVFFLLLSGDLYKRKLITLTGRAALRRRLTGEVLDEISAQIGRFLLVRLVASAAVAIVTAGALWVLGLEHAIVWGVLAGIFNTVEYLGPVLVSGGLAIVAFLQFGALSSALAISGVALAITSLEGWLVTPALLGRATRMNAVVVFLGLLFWGWVWGPLGLILAVPMLVIVKAVCDRVDELSAVGRLMSD